MGELQYVAICIEMDYKRMGRKESKRVARFFGKEKISSSISNTN
jgi:hypothetical protein